MSRPKRTIIIYRTEPGAADMQWQVIADEEGVGLELRISMWTASQAHRRQSEAHDKATTLLGDIADVIAVELTDLTPAGGNSSNREECQNEPY